METLLRDRTGPGSLEGEAPAAAGARLEELACGDPERDALMRWLDVGLRDGCMGQIRAEYGCVLERPETEHVVVRVADRIVSHALLTRVAVRAGGRRSALGMIGLVYTEPAFRRRGLAARCIEGAARRLAARGARLAALWSDRRDFYARLGFLPAGRERMLRIDAPRLAAAAGAGGLAGRVAAPFPADWPALEALYAARPSRVERPPGTLRSLAAAPNTRIWVCRSRGAPIAYAACGRGRDFGGVVHEWAGATPGVLACLAAAVDRSGPLLLMAGPEDEPLPAALRAAGAPETRGCFALVRLLDPLALWRDLLGDAPPLADLLRPADGGGLQLTGRAGRVPLDAASALELVLDGPSGPARAALDAAELAALETRLPWPLFVWGFDSV